MNMIFKTPHSRSVHLFMLLLMSILMNGCATQADKDLLSTLQLSRYPCSEQTHHQVQMLLQGGANAKSQYHNNKYYNSPALVVAARRGCLNIVRTLVEYGADVNAANNHGLTALMIASGDTMISSHYDLAKFLIEQGADVNAIKESKKNTLLTYAIRRGHLDIAQLLLENGADPNVVVEPFHETPLWRVRGSSRSREELAELLIQYGADVNAKNHKGMSLVADCVATSGKTSGPLVDLLLRHGADPDVELKTKNSWDGWTPLTIAARLGRFQMTALLVQYGADVNKPNREGKTALDIAMFYVHTDIVNLLSKADK